MDNTSHNNQDVGSVPSTPATPGTPGAPLFGGFKSQRSESNGHRRSSVLNNCRCFSVEAWALEDGDIGSTCALPPPPVPLVKKVGAEFIGTLILMFASTAVAIVNQKTNGSVTLLGAAACAGLAVMVVILATGHISGAHLNPAVTIAFAALKHFPWKQVPMYIGAQALASICAAFALKGIFNPFMSGGVTVPSCGHGQAFALEFIIGFNLMFVVTAVATDTRAVGELAGIAIGATVMLNVLIAGAASGGSMNPVRSLGPAIAANNYRAIWVYLTAPIVGALCGAGAYSLVKLPENTDSQDKPSSTTASFRR
ncbi:hypothetical protein Sjap_010930 [Stephania japonica]|uniref:Aquaporin NIP6-1 n=1 Tax=Stephania japonica TaxID=461633 RepID=A0AAP0JCJ2_9MAGN